MHRRSERVGGRARGPEETEGRRGNEARLWGSRRAVTCVDAAVSLQLAWFGKGLLTSVTLEHPRLLRAQGRTGLMRLHVLLVKTNTHVRNTEDHTRTLDLKQERKTRRRKARQWEEDHRLASDPDPRGRSRSRVGGGTRWMGGRACSLPGRPRLPPSPWAASGRGGVSASLPVGHRDSC